MCCLLCALCCVVGCRFVVVWSLCSYVCVGVVVGEFVVVLFWCVLFVGLCVVCAFRSVVHLCNCWDG